MAVLQKRAAVCDFVCACSKPVSDIFCRAQFIRGIRDNAIREQLLQKPDESFLQIVEKAIAMEAARINNNEIMNKPSTSDVHKIRQKETKKQKEKRNT